MENKEKKSILGTLVMILAIIGLLTAAVVTVGYLFKKIKKAHSQLCDTDFDPLEEEDLTTVKDEDGEARKDGCSVSCSF